VPNYTEKIHTELGLNNRWQENRPKGFSPFDHPLVHKAKPKKRGTKSRIEKEGK